MAISATAEKKAVFCMHLQLLHDMLAHFTLHIAAQCQLSAVNLIAGLLTFFIVAEKKYASPFYQMNLNSWKALNCAHSLVFVPVYTGSMDELTILDRLIKESHLIFWKCDYFWWLF